MSERGQKKHPRRLIRIVTPTCDAGQHVACPTVGDPESSWDVVVCLCDCHEDSPMFTIHRDEAPKRRR